MQQAAILVSALILSSAVAVSMAMPVPFSLLNLLWVFCASLVGLASLGFFTWAKVEFAALFNQDCLRLFFFGPENFCVSWDVKSYKPLGKIYHIVVKLSHCH
jgi:hypothetical protein